MRLSFLAGDGGGELGAVAHAELAVDVAEVRLDRLGAEEQLGRGFPDGGAVGDDQRDAKFLRGEHVGGGMAAGGWGADAGGAEFAAGALCPWVGGESLEGSERVGKLVAGVCAAARSAESLAIAQLGAGALQRARHVIVQPERVQELFLECVVFSEQATAACRCRESP